MLQRNKHTAQRNTTQHNTQQYRPKEIRKTFSLPGNNNRKSTKRKKRQMKTLKFILLRNITTNCYNQTLRSVSALLLYSTNTYINNYTHTHTVLYQMKC